MSLVTVLVILLVIFDYFPDNITIVAHHRLLLAATGGPLVECPANSQWSTGGSHQPLVAHRWPTSGSRWW